MFQNAFLKHWLVKLNLHGVNKEFLDHKIIHSFNLAFLLKGRKQQVVHFKRFETFTSIIHIVLNKTITDLDSD